MQPTDSLACVAVVIEFDDDDEALDGVRTTRAFTVSKMAVVDGVEDDEVVDGVEDDEVLTVSRTTRSLTVPKMRRLSTALKMPRQPIVPMMSRSLRL